MLSKYQPEHCRTMHEFAGFNPDLVLLDENQTPEIATELMDWGIHVCILAERVTVSLRRKFPMVKDMVTDGKLLDYLDAYFTPAHEENDQKDEVRSSVSNHESATTMLAVAVETSSPSISLESSPIMRSTRVEPRSNRNAKVVGFVSLRSHGGSAGKTGVLYNYAAYSAKQGKKVVVVDLDPSGPFGELAEATQDLTTEHWCNLMNQYQEGGMTERAVFDNVEQQKRYGFYMIPASTSSEAMIEKEQFRWILAQMITCFDLVVFDLPATWTMTTIEMMRNADELFLFGPYDRYQYKAFKRTIEKITHPLNVGLSRDRLYAFLGRGYLNKNKEIELEEVKRQLGLDKVILIPEDPLFHQYRNESKAIVLENPKAECAKPLIPWLERQMSDEMAGSNLPTTYEPLTHKSGGLFAWLFSKKNKVHRGSAR